jgi:hypothetical protein
MSHEIEDPRREFLVRALGLGLFAGGAGGILSLSDALALTPGVLPPGRSVYRLEGDVWVDGKPANISTLIETGSTVKTGDNGMIIFVVGTDAFILRANSELQLNGSGLLISFMRLLTGRLLSVFGQREETHRITTLTATIGIRGTGIYVESDPEQSYVCTCYGHTLISSNDQSDAWEEVRTHHHDNPLYVLAGKTGEVIRPAPFINHTDSELALIEELVGRAPPFAFSNDIYRAPRRRNY